jgi:hypothetical protein
MTRKYFHAGAIAVACSGALVMAQAVADARPQQSPQSPSTTQPTTSVSQSVTTLSGCVYQEKDVPGRSPNVAERAGILEDYILAEVTPSPTASTPSTSTPGTAGTSGTVTSGAMYKLELVDDAKLKTLVGKRVEVTGRIDAEPGDKTDTPTAPPTTPTDRAIGRDRVDLPEFEVTSIREVSGTCPTKPSVR